MENNIDIQREIHTLSRDLQEELSVKGQLIGKTLINVERSCFEKAGTDSEVFVDCMYDASNTIDKEQRKLELRSAFFQAQAAECLLNSDGNAESIRKCKVNALSNLQFAFDSFIDNIKF